MVTASFPPPGLSSAAPPIGPSIEVWKTMDAAAREAFLLKVIDALSDPRDLMTEGRPHKLAKLRAIDLLGLHFKAMGRSVYLAEDLAVVYPGEESFSPDVLAVVDVPQPQVDERMAWVVADEGKGPDVVLEVLHRGDRDKDLVRNVDRYARLGIPEYFVYDRARQCIRGHRLVTPGQRTYQRIVPQAGRFTSAVLGLDLAVQNGTLQFFQGAAELFGIEHLVERLTGMMGNVEARADAEAARADQEAANARQEAARAQQAITGVREGILSALAARGVACPDSVRERILGCDDPTTLQRWLLRAITVATADDVLAE